MTTTVDAFDLDLTALAGELQGEVLRPGQPGYDDEVATFNLGTTHTPPVVVAARSAADVAAAVRFAGTHGLPVGVNATGHGPVTAIDTGIMVSTKHMTDVRIDPSSRTATVAAGAKWKAVVEAGAPHGLAPLCGSSSDVGVVGYTVGGGLPLLCRTFGFAADHVQAMTVVTADGVVRTATPERETDLFWGLRGGKGNLGIVTEIVVDLVPVAKLYGGGIYFAGEHAAAVLNAFREWSATLDEKSNASIGLLRLPPIPDIPEPLRGKFVVHVRLAYVGSPEDGEQVIAPMRSVAPAIIDTLAEMPYTAMDSIYNDPDHPIPAHERSMLLRDLSEDVVDHLLAVAGPDVQTPVLMIDLRQMGGALRRSPAVPNAVGSRDAGFLLFAVGALMPPIAEIVPGAVDSVVAPFEPFSTGYTMVNLHGRPGDAADRARAWAPEVYNRLCQLKTAYDPMHMFCFSHAIPDAAVQQAAEVVPPRDAQ